MRPHFLLLFIPFLYVSLHAQLIDDFSDGDFLNNPTWQGDTSNFIINANNQLQLNAPSVTDTSFLVVETGILDFTNTITWEFYVKLDLSPSNSNNFRYYLTSNNANLRGNLNGYFIRVGENGSTDKIKLYRQDGTSTTLLMTGLNGAYGVSPEFRVRVNRDINGNWEVLSDSIGEHLLFMRVEQLTIRTSSLLFQEFGVKEPHQTQITFILMIFRLMAT